MRSQKPQMQGAETKLERALSFLLLHDERVLRRHLPVLDEQMFAEAANYLFLCAADDLHKAHTFSKPALLSQAERRGVDSAEKHYTQMQSCVSSASRPEQLIMQWLPGGRLRFLQRSEMTIRDEEDPDEIARKRVEAISHYRKLGKRDTGVLISVAANDAVAMSDRLFSSKGSAILSTGFAELDAAIIGFIPGTMVVLAARPGVGKTTYALQIALAAARLGPVIFNSLEMSPAMLSIRLGCQMLGLNSRAYLAPHLLSEAEYRARRKELLDVLQDVDIHITRSVSARELEPAIAELQPSLVIHDYIQKPPTPARYRGNRVEFLDDAAQEWADVSAETGVPSLVLSQLKRGDQRKGMSDIKGSGGIEEAADAVILLESRQDEEGVESLKREGFVAKARYGIDGVRCDILFDARSQTFVPWSLTSAGEVWRDMYATSISVP